MQCSTRKLWKRATRRLLAACWAFGVACWTGALVAADDAQAPEVGARRLEVRAIDKRPTKCFALLVGVNQYENGLPDLSYATSDALALKETLVKIGFPEESVQVFFTSANVREHPTRKRIMEAFNRIVEEADEESAIFVSFSGHGFETKDGLAAFCPMDVEVDSSVDPPVVEKETAIVVNDVAEALRRSKARFKMLVVDACRETANSRTVDGEDKKRGFARPDVTGLAFLQSCDSGQLSYENASLGRGVFTHYLIEGLEGKAATDDGGVSFLNVCSYVARKTKGFVEQTYSRTQTPLQEFKGVDFWLVEPTKDDGELLYRQGREALLGENGRNIDRTAAFDLLSKAVAAGSLPARALSASILLNGAPGVEIDAQEAFRLAQEPARQGDPWAQHVLGECYSNGLGTIRDEKKGNEFRSKAFAGFQQWAESGDADAMDSLGIYYFLGYGTAKNDKKAAELFARAVEKGSVTAATHLGFCYMHEIGLERDAAKGIKLLEEAYARNEVSAAYTLGEAYWSSSGERGVDKDDAKALEWFRKGREGADDDSIWALAECYEYGVGVEADEAEAAKLYEEAARLNHSRAIAQIGFAHLNGNLGYEKDPKKAVEYLKRAADMDDVQALSELKRCYENGIGIKKSLREAAKLRGRAQAIRARHSK